MSTPAITGTETAGAARSAQSEATRNGASGTPPSKQEERIDKALKISEKWLVTSTGIISAISGALSFLLHNFLDKPSEIVDAISTWASKASVFFIATFGGVTKLRDKDAFGTSAFIMDLLASVFASGESLYQWKGWGSGTDHSIPILSEIAYNPKTIEKYGLMERQSEFNEYKNFLDSGGKLLFGVKSIFQDVKEEFKKNNFGRAFMNCFINGERTAEKNLLVSGLGILGGAFMYTILKLKLIGATVRDGFGFYADLAYIDKGRSRVSGKVDQNAKKEYLAGGIFYTIGSILDLIYRWTETPGLNLFALGIDRLGHTRFVKGVARDVDVSRNSNGGNGHTATAQAAPALAT